MAGRQTVTQAEITRAIKAAQAAGLKVYQFEATKRGVRVITSEGAERDEPKVNPWDRFLSDGKAE